MTVAKTEVQVTWSAANSVSVSAAGTQTSDAATLSAATFGLLVSLKADNDGTPAAGDTVDLYLLQSVGDPDGASTDEYDTATQGTHLARMDTNANDPAQTTVWVPGGAKGVKIYAKSNAASNAITVSAAIYEHTA